MRRDVGKTNLSLEAKEEFWNFPGGPGEPPTCGSHMPRAVAREKKKDGRVGISGRSG